MATFIHIVYCFHYVTVIVYIIILTVEVVIIEYVAVCILKLYSIISVPKNTFHTQALRKQYFDVWLEFSKDLGLGLYNLAI